MILWKIDDDRFHGDTPALADGGNRYSTTDCRTLEIKSSRDLNLSILRRVMCHRGTAVVEYRDAIVSAHNAIVRSA